jgi:hypothetical protein
MPPSFLAKELQFLFSFELKLTLFLSAGNTSIRVHQVAVRSWLHVYSHILICHCSELPISWRSCWLDWNLTEGYLRTMRTWARQDMGDLQ